MYYGFDESVLETTKNHLLLWCIKLAFDSSRVQRRGEKRKLGHFKLKCRSPRMASFFLFGLSTMVHQSGSILTPLSLVKTQERWSKPLRNIDVDEDWYLVASLVR
jgi:hypothetical protein